MNKKARIYFKSIIFSLLIIFIFLINGSKADSPLPNIGYEVIGNTVHIWNTQDDYFFNSSSGIQFSNYYQDYWSRNIFCLGYYSGETWNKIKCADELENFDEDIQTDNSTYVNATLWKDFTYEGYDLRFGIRYHLKHNDDKLSVIISVKNRDVDDIPYDLGFGWKVTDLELPRNVAQDKIKINNTYYNLSDNINITFSDIKTFYNNSYYSAENETYYEDEGYEYYPYFRITDEKELRLDWDENLNYKIRLYSDGSQENAYTFLLINGGTFNSGVEKSTIIYWIDAPVVDTAGTENEWADATVGLGQSIMVGSSNVYLNNVTKYSDGNPTNVTLYTYVASDTLGQALDSATFVGDTADFDYYGPLSSETKYVLIADNNGANYTKAIDNSPNYPYSGTNVDFVTANQLDSGTYSESTGEDRAIASVTTDTEAPPSNQPPNFDAIDNFEKNEDFANFIIDVSANISDDSDADASLVIDFVLNDSSLFSIDINNITDEVNFTSATANQSGVVNVNLTVWDTEGEQNSTAFDLIINAVNDAPWKEGDLSNSTFDSDTTSPIDNLIPKTDVDANFSDVEENNAPTTYELVTSTNTSTSCFFDGSNNWDCEIVSNATNIDLYTIAVNDSGGLAVIYDWQITMNDASAPYIVSTVLRGWENNTQQYDFYNETSAYDIEKFNITAEFNDDSTITEVELFWRTTNGTNNVPDRCTTGDGASTGTTGNINDETCYQYLSAIEDTDTGTMYEGMTVGEGVDFTNITVNLTSRKVEFMIDELYKNTVKDYPFYGNTSYFDNGSNYRITKNNYREWVVSRSEEVPSDAQYYQFDLRMQIVNNPRFPLEIYLCNATYVSGEPFDTVNCAILNTLTSDDVKPADATKYRTTFGNDTIDDLGGNITDGSVVLKTEEPSPNRYYAVTYFDKRSGDTFNHSYYSTDSGSTWTQMEDKSDAIGLHWFYEGTTCFEYFFETTDNESNVANSTVNSQCWSEVSEGIDDKPSEPILTAPLEFYNWSSTQTITWIKSEDPEGHDHFYEISLQNEDGTYNSTIADESTNITKSTTSYSWDTSSVSDGVYNMTIKAVQNESTIGLNSTKFIMAQGFTVDNTYPFVNIDSPSGSYQGLEGGNNQIDLKYSVSDNNLESCWYNTGGGNTTLTSCANTTLTLNANSYTLNLYSNDSAGNENSTTTTFTINPFTTGAGGGSGGGAYTGYNLSYICELTYKFIQDYSKNYTEEGLDLLHQQTKEDLGFYINKYTLRDYINNWNVVCSETIGISLESLTMDIAMEENVTNITKRFDFEVPNCSLDLGDSGIYYPFTNKKFIKFNEAVYFQNLLKLNIGPIKCKNINMLRWFFPLKFSGDNVIVRGIRTYVLVLLAILCIITFILFKKEVIKIKYKKKEG